MKQSILDKFAADAIGAPENVTGGGGNYGKPGKSRSKKSRKSRKSVKSRSKTTKNRCGCPCP